MKLCGEIWFAIKYMAFWLCVGAVVVATILFLNRGWS